MLHGARIALSLLSALSANMVPACGRSFGPDAARDRDVARATAAPDQAAVSLVALHQFRSLPAFASSAPATDVRYVANSGMLVTASGRRFLIDAPIRDGIAPYRDELGRGARLARRRPRTICRRRRDSDYALARGPLQRRRRGRAPVSSNPRAILVPRPPDIVDRVRGVAPALAAARLRAVLPPPGQSQRVDIAGTPVRVLRIRHNPSRRLPEQHLGFLIGDSAPVLHVGDAIPPPTTLPCCDRCRRSTWRSFRSM